jgi:hypothetical protein
MQKEEKNNSLVNLTSSIAKHYHLDYYYPTNSYFDSILAKNYRHVAIILLDGFGEYDLKMNEECVPFLSSHQVGVGQSVIPPTTVAATTALQTGLSPIESGWMGWHLYLDENTPSVILFQNRTYYTNREVAKDFVSSKIQKQSIFEKIENYHEIYPSFKQPEVTSFQIGIDKLKQYFSSPSNNFTYFYWTNPDTDMHEFGITSQNVKKDLIELDAGIKDLFDSMTKDDLVICLADHGHINVEPVYLNDYPELLATFAKPIAGESRFAQIYVKPECSKQFEEIFTKNFGQDFKLMKREDFLLSKMSGELSPDMTTRYSIGDYVAMGITNKYFTDSRDANDFIFKGHHAGITKEELEIPWIVLSKSEKK